MMSQRVHLHGKRIIRTLLVCFPEHDIIFRAFPRDLTSPIIQDIIQCFSGNPRFHLDTQTSYLDTFVATQVMVTDVSHVASSFTLTTLRPSIYFQPWCNTGIVRNTSLTCVTTSYSDLVAAIREAINARPFHDSQKLYKEFGLLPVEHAVENLAKIIPDFIDSRPHEDWLIIQREKQRSGISLSRMITAIRQDFEFAHEYLSLFYAEYFHRPALAVFALHLLKQRRPETSVPQWLLTLAGIAPAEGERRYADIGTEELVRLYMAAAEDEKARSRQPEQIKMQDVTTLYELARLVVEDTPL